MMYRALALGALAAPLAFAAPLEKKQNLDVTVLQFALTLEHLENVFYKGALTKFSAADFAAAGYGPNYYNSLRYIASDEETHTKFLTTALQGLGEAPVAACTYNFPYTDVKSFITLSTVLEGVGVSAYLGGAGLITSKAYLTAAGSILVSESLHTSLQRSALSAIPNANPFGTPLEPNSVYTLAAAFIKSCPPANAALPFKPYPGLTYDGTTGFCEQPNCGPAFAKREAEPVPEPVAEANKSPCPSSSTTSAYYAAHPTSAAHPTYSVSPTTKATKPTYSSQPTYAPHPSSSYQPTYAPHPTSSAQPTYAPQPSYTSKAPTQPTTVPSPPAPVAGTSVSFTAMNAVPAGSFLTFVSGLTVTSVAGQISGQKISAAIPAGISGQSYVFVTSAAAANNTLDASKILFGPSILEVKPAPPSIDFSYQK